jgi:hypothetical protein
LKRFGGLTIARIAAGFDGQGQPLGLVLLDFISRQVVTGRFHTSILF